MKERRSGHDPGRVVWDLAVMLADGGECVSDLSGLRDQLALFGGIASHATAYRVTERIASSPELVDALRAAHAKARAHAWELGVKPGRVTIDLDATLITAHSEKDGAAGNFKGGFGFAPMMAYCDESSEALAGMLRPGNAGTHSASDQIAAAESALDQIPREHVQELEILPAHRLRRRRARTRGLLPRGRIGFSVGFDLTEPVRSAILDLPEDAWVPALEKDGKIRPNGQLAELTGLVNNCAAIRPRLSAMASNAWLTPAFARQRTVSPRDSKRLSSVIGHSGQRPSSRSLGDLSRWSHT